jgi:hypothetical protein
MTTHRTRTRFAALLVAALLAFGCDDAEESPADTAADLTSTADGAGTTSTTDTNADATVQTDATAATDATGNDDTAVDATESDTSTAADTAQGDATADTTDPDVTPCDPATLLAEYVATNTTAQADGLVALTWTAGELAGTLDASSGGATDAAGMSWVYVSADPNTPGQLLLSDAEAATDSTWHFAFRRTGIRVNSGDSGPGPWLLEVGEGASFDVAMPPGADAQWAADQLVDTEACALLTDERGNLLNTLSQWWDYDPIDHVVSPTPDKVFFFYHPGTHEAFKLAIEDYADGVYTIRYASAF